MSSLRKIHKFFNCLLKRPSSFPYEAQIEVTNRCNLTCPMCPRKALALPEEDMPLSLFHELVSRLQGIKSLILMGFGEPLMHPQFIPLVQEVNALLPIAEVKLATNGYLLHEALARDLLRNCRVAQINFSIEGVKDEIQGVQEGHPSHEEVLHNIHNLIRLRGRSPRPRITIQSLLLEGNEAQIEDVIRFAAQAGSDSFNLQRVWDYGGLVPSLKRPSYERQRESIEGLKAIAKKEGIAFHCINHQSLAMRLASHFDRLCLRTDDHLYIDIEGQVTPCCNLRSFVVGHLLHEPLRDIWHGQRLQHFRRNQLSICGSCDVLKGAYFDGT